MAYIVKGTPGYSSEGTTFEAAPSAHEAWDKAIDAWKGVPTAHRSTFRQQAFEAMQRNGYQLVVED